VHGWCSSSRISTPSRAVWRAFGFCARHQAHRGGVSGCPAIGLLVERKGRAELLRILPADPSTCL